jgi:YgiT-type zinc finger domain-containing protein
MIRINACPSCGSDKIKCVRRNWRGEFQGRPYIVPALEFHECPDCGERVYDREAMRKIETHSPAFAKEHAGNRSEKRHAKRLMKEERLWS